MLRLGHRPARDKRITTHVALTARAFGADRMYVTTKDGRLEARIGDVTNRFGGEFQVETGISRRKVLREWAGNVVHLTMYGLPLEEVLGKLPEDRILTVVGGAKVPGEVFEAADYNVAVGNQPHSEVAALAVFLDRLLEGEGLRRPFDGQLQVVPSARGKTFAGNREGGSPGSR